VKSAGIASIVVLAILGAVLAFTSGSSPSKNRGGQQASEREGESREEQELEEEGLGPEDSYLF
jgi:hypothetical protein